MKEQILETFYEKDIEAIIWDYVTCKEKIKGQGAMITLSDTLAFFSSEKNEAESKTKSSSELQNRIIKDLTKIFEGYLNEDEIIEFTVNVVENESTLSVDKIKARYEFNQIKKEVVVETPTS